MSVNLTAFWLSVYLSVRMCCVVWGELLFSVQHRASSCHKTASRQLAWHRSNQVCHALYYTSQTCQDRYSQIKLYFSPIVNFVCLVMPFLFYVDWHRVDGKWTNTLKLTTSIYFEYFFGINLCAKHVILCSFQDD